MFDFALTEAKPMKENWTRICTRCKSREVTERGMTSGVYSNDWTCLSGGWHGSAFPEIRKKVRRRIAQSEETVYKDIAPYSCR